MMQNNYIFYYYYKLVLKCICIYKWDCVCILYREFPIKKGLMDYIYHLCASILMDMNGVLYNINLGHSLQ